MAAAEEDHRNAIDAAVLDHARELAAEFVERSAKIDCALLEIVDAHRERQRLAVEIISTGCLHKARAGALDCPIRMHSAICVAKAGPILAPNQVPATGAVFKISTLAAEHRQTLSGLSLEYCTARSNF